MLAVLASYGKNEPPGDTVLLQQSAKVVHQPVSALICPHHPLLHAGLGLLGRDILHLFHGVRRHVIGHDVFVDLVISSLFSRSLVTGNSLFRAK